MAIQLSTAGITVNYAVETAADTRPTTGYKKIPEIKSIPELNPAPETLETTTLEQTDFKTYINGLRDLGGALEFTANLTQQLMDEWETMMEAYETATTAGKNMWFCIIIPGLTKSWYFQGQPADMGLPGAEVSAVLETTLYITPVGEPVKEAKPTTTMNASEPMMAKSTIKSGGTMDEV